MGMQTKSKRMGVSTIISPKSPAQPAAAVTTEDTAVIIVAIFLFFLS
jgi:hypothetical protein